MDMAMLSVMLCAHVASVISAASKPVATAMRTSDIRKRRVRFRRKRMMMKTGRAASSTPKNMPSEDMFIVPSL